MSIDKLERLGRALGLKPRCGCGITTPPELIHAQCVMCGSQASFGWLETTAGAEAVRAALHSVLHTIEIHYGFDLDGVAFIWCGIGGGSDLAEYKSYYSSSTVEVTLGAALKALEKGWLA